MDTLIPQLPTGDTWFQSEEDGVQSANYGTTHRISKVEEELRYESRHDTVVKKERHVDPIIAFMRAVDKHTTMYSRATLMDMEQLTKAKLVDFVAQPDIQRVLGGRTCRGAMAALMGSTIAISKTSLDIVLNHILGSKIDK